MKFRPILLLFTILVFVESNAYSQNTAMKTKCNRQATACKRLWDWNSLSFDTKSKRGYKCDKLMMNCIEALGPIESACTAQLYEEANIACDPIRECADITAVTDLLYNRLEVLGERWIFACAKYVNGVAKEYAANAQSAAEEFAIQQKEEDLRRTREAEAAKQETIKTQEAEARATAEAKAKAEAEKEAKIIAAQKEAEKEKMALESELRIQEEAEMSAIRLAEKEEMMEIQKANNPAAQEAFEYIKALDESVQYALENFDDLKLFTKGIISCSSNGCTFNMAVRNQYCDLSRMPCPHPGGSPTNAIIEKDAIKATTSYIVQDLKAAVQAARDVYDAALMNVYDIDAINSQGQDDLQSIDNVTNKVISFADQAYNFAQGGLTIDIWLKDYCDRTNPVSQLWGSRKHNNIYHVDTNSSCCNGQNNSIEQPCGKEVFWFSNMLIAGAQSDSQSGNVSCKVNTNNSTYTCSTAQNALVMPIFAYLQAAVDLAATDLRQAARKHYAYLNQALQGGVAETDTYGANCVPTNVDIYPKCELPHLKQLLDGKQYDQMITKIRLILINLNISTSSWENGILEEIEEGESTINDTIAIELYHAIVRDVMEGGSSGGW